MDREAAARKTRAFVERMESENHGLMFATNKACQTCMFAHGDVNWNGNKLVLNPGKCFCQMYEPDDSNGKPQDVAFDGAPCEWYERELPSQIRRQNERRP